MVSLEKQLAGIYVQEEEAIQAIKELINNGYDANDISVLAKENTTVEHVVSHTDVEELSPISEEAYGLIGGFLSGISNGFIVPGLLIPGIGPIMAAGPFVSMFKGNSIKDLKDTFLSYDIPESEVSRYLKHLQSGHIIVLVEKN